MARNEKRGKRQRASNEAPTGAPAGADMDDARRPKAEDLAKLKPSREEIDRLVDDEE